MRFTAIIKKITSTAKETAAGETEIMTALGLETGYLGAEDAKALHELQRSGLLRVTVEAIQADLPLERGRTRRSEDA